MNTTPEKGSSVCLRNFDLKGSRLFLKSRFGGLQIPQILKFKTRSAQWILNQGLLEIKYVRIFWKIMEEFYASC